MEFKNKEGQVVLKRTYDAGVKHDTYYVHDQFGNLTFVIPPLVDATVTISNEILGDLCYQYKYDYRNRLVEKKLPGKQWEFIVYDKLDRVVATGPTFSPFSDPAQIGLLGWLITKYDAFNRPVYTGWEQSTTITNAGRVSKQNSINGLTTINETKQSSGTIDGITANYSNTVLPTTFKLLTVNYYDDYNFPNAPSFPTYSYSGVSSFYNNSTMKPKGLATGSWVRVPDFITNPVKAETSYVLFDYKARPIRNYITNYLGGFTRTDIDLDFSGKTTYTYTTHKRLSTDAQTYIREYFTYSPQDRLLTHTHQINSLPVQLLASNTYDELGQLISKNVGNTTITPLQKVDYAYNIRGWLTSINNDPTNNLILNTSEKDLFAFKINYTTTEGNVASVKPLYNGNISETYYRTGSDNVLRKYGYEYDNLNRLKNAIYQKPGGNTYPTYEDYSEKNITYDKNGNIQTLYRNGDLADALPANQIDNLQYSYKANSNILNSVYDNSANTSGFKDGNTLGIDYGYDANGNMTSDKNKNITAIVYNHLNLPTKITFGTTGNITYIYNANGQKVQKQVFTSSQGSIPIASYYLNEFQYVFRENYADYLTKLQFVTTSEGYYDFLKVKYVFNHTDHLGNIRLSYAKNPTTNVLEIIEENNYYPFGLKHSPSAVINGQPNYKYKYNGKELQDDNIGGQQLNWYDYGARNYDPALGRWMNMDEKSEKYYSFSPYTYVANNPLLYIDPNGKEIIVSNKKDQGAVLKMINSQALGTFAFNKAGQLYLANSKGDASKFSSYYQKQLVAAIKDSDKITISIGQTFQEKGKTKSVDNDAGGGVTSLSKTTTTDPNTGAKTITKEADITVSGNPLVGLKDTNGKPLTDSPADILAHELVGHAIPFITKPDTGDAVKNENKVRKETNSPERGPDPYNHKEF